MANHRHDNPNRLDPHEPKVSPVHVADRFGSAPISLHTGYGNGLNKLRKAMRQARRAQRTADGMPYPVRMIERAARALKRKAQDIARRVTRHSRHVSRRASARARG